MYILCAKINKINISLQIGNFWAIHKGKINKINNTLLQISNFLRKGPSVKAKINKINNILLQISDFYEKAHPYRKSIWLFQSSCSSIGIMHRYAASPSWSIRAEIWRHRFVILHYEAFLTIPIELQLHWNNASVRRQPELID